MSDVYICHCYQDSAVFRNLHSFLRRRHITCWTDPENQPYPGPVLDAIKNCGVFVLLLSENAQKSVYIQHEVDYALRCEKDILVYEIQAVTLNDTMNYLLQGVEFIPAWQQPRKSTEILASTIRLLLTN